VGRGGAKHPVSEVKVKDNKLSFTSKFEFGDNMLVSKYSGRPYNDKLSRVINKEINGNEFQVQFTAKRAPKKGKDQ